ncbi:hypothetical protein [Armatimonas sp.]|uniref:hypothetical protein n=1 Tax=Armatimonas sp. TaxID=1872638 RepID=UPI00286C78A6|nr:hypothetical protein [Armatimonas sp.]
MHHPEFDDLCHEVAGKLSELRRLTMETAVFTDDQEALLAEITRLLRLLDATSSQQIHSLLGDTATSDSAFLAEFYEELPLLATPAERVALSPTASEPTPASFVPHSADPPLVQGRVDARDEQPGGFRELPVPPGLLEEIYWDIQPVYKGDTRLLFAHDTDWHFCLIVTHETGQTALLFDTDEARAAYLGEVYREALDRPKPDEEEGGDPSAPVLAPLLPRTPVLAGGNARRLEEAVEESEL